jgi:phosphotransferase system enzyme I (PtsI)
MEKGKNKSMKFKGIGISGIITIGKVFLYIQEPYTIPRYLTSDPEKELEKFNNALSKAIQEYSSVKKHLESDISEDELLLFTSFDLFLKDEQFKSMVENEIRKGNKNAEWALYVVIEELVSRFKNISNINLAQRSEDISAIGEKIMMNLISKTYSPELNNIPENTIIVARTISPTDPILIQHKKIAGLVTELGGFASHTAIMTRGLSIPAVLGVEFITSEAQNDDIIIINPLKGDVILRPDEKEIEDAMDLKVKQEKLLLSFNEFSKNETSTKDGFSIDILGNIELVDELPSLLNTSAKGIGLYRSEFLVLQSNSFPPEDVQYKHYLKIFSTYGNDREITIRTLDLGGDKIIPGYVSANEKNPFLGWRAIRFCLSRPSLFLEQLKAILRAGSNAKNLKIMVPMISNFEEIIETRKLLKLAEKSLKEANIPYCSSYKFGIMFEIPSVMYILDDIASKIDFISIGTNDLIQYLLACDRGNEKVAYLFRYMNPSILRFLSQLISKANSLKLEVSMCGEMASDVLSIPLLLGMGLKRFSIPPSLYNMINKLISMLSMTDCQNLLKEVISLSEVSEIENIVVPWLKKRAPEVLEYCHLIK